MIMKHEAQEEHEESELVLSALFVCFVFKNPT
jgi:hypothetical protein